VYLRLRREGWSVNRKRVYRIYREAGLAVRRRKRKRIGAVERKPLPKPVAANLSWSMDFVSDGLADGRRLRCLTVVDDCTRECLAIEVDTSITGTRVKHVMNRLAEARGLPQSITVDNGPEFQGQVLDAWAYQAGVNLSFIRPGKPNENMRISNRSTASSETNASMSIGSSRWRKPAKSSNSGGSSTTPNDHTAQSETSRRKNTPRI